jgi:transposase
MPKPGRFPSSIQEAAAHLGVSHMTVRRWMSRLEFREWTEEAWTAVSAKVRLKERWRQVTAHLREMGLREEAARKRVQRLKRTGRTPDEARRQHASPQSRKGTCTACGDEQVLGELYQGKFHCSVCYAEKRGIFPTE